MVKNLKQKSSIELTEIQKHEFTRLARQIVGNIKVKSIVDDWDPLSGIVETPITDVIPDGHVIVRSETFAKPIYVTGRKVAK